MHPRLANLTDDQAQQLRAELRSNLYGRRTFDAPFTPAGGAPRQPRALRMLEQRIGLAEHRAADAPDEGAELRVSGLSAVFDQRTELGFTFWGIRVWWHEVIARGFFRKALAAPDLDCCFLVNHDPNLLLARTVNGTLRLEERTIGLYSEADLIDNTLGRDTYKSIERGDMYQQSFAFTLAEGGDEWDETDAYDTFDDDDQPDEIYLGLRILRECEKLYDTSPVTYPAYPTTNVGVSRGEAVATDDRHAATGEESSDARGTQRDVEGSDQQLDGKGDANGSTRTVPDDQPHQEETPCESPLHSSKSATPLPPVSTFSRRRRSTAR